MGDQLDNQGVWPVLQWLDAGTLPYEEALALQRELADARKQGEIPDTLLLLEHPPVYTRGRRSGPQELPMGEGWYRSQGIDIFDSDRGGRVTYHGPGQLVGYPIVSLRPFGDDVHEYVRRLERVIAASLADCGIEAGVIDGLTGVWTSDRRKIASIGVHVSRGVTTHGFAINVNNDLRPFSWIVPCGIEGCQVTSVAQELGRDLRLPDFMSTVVAEFGCVYERHPARTTLAALRARLAGHEVAA